MIKPARSFVLVAVAALALTACGSSDSSKNAAESQLGAIQSAVAQGANSSAGADSSTASSDATSPDAASSDSSTSSDSSSSSGSATDPTTVDVCALLSPADGNSVAQANGLGSFSATKDDRGIPGSSACQFTFGGSKSVIMEVRAGSFIQEYQLDPKVNGLGDEAYDDGTSPAMRVGDLLVTAEMNSLSDAATLDLLRKMAPNMK